MPETESEVKVPETESEARVPETESEARVPETESEQERKGGGWGGARPALAGGKTIPLLARKRASEAPSEEGEAPGEGGGSCSGGRAPGEVGASELGFGRDVLG